MQPDAHSDWVIGADLGQARDYSVFLFFERTRVGDETRFALRWIERFRDRPYDEAAELLAGMIEATPELRGRSTVVMDATGVGRGFADFFARTRSGAHLVKVTITAGAKLNRDGADWNVPKEFLVFAVATALRAKKLKFSSRLNHVSTLVEELEAFSVNFTPTGREVYGNNARLSPHDDLVLACGMAVFYGGQQGDAWLSMMRKAAAAPVATTPEGLPAERPHPGSQRLPPSYAATGVPGVEEYLEGLRRACPPLPPYR